MNRMVAIFTRPDTLRLLPWRYMAMGAAKIFPGGIGQKFFYKLTFKLFNAIFVGCP
jgi:hypothetical protein